MFGTNVVRIRLVVWMPELQLVYKQTVMVIYQIIKDSVIYFMSVCIKTVGAVFLNN